MILDEYAAAVETALATSGFELERYQFLGYLPRGERALAGLWGGVSSWPHYRCDRRRRGLPEIEAHHLFGPNTPLTVALPVNEHRVFDAIRLSRPRFLQEPGSELLVNAAQLALLSGEIAVMIADHVRREAGPQWVVALADILAGKAREVAEALLLFGGHLVECAGAQWQQGAPKWRP